MRDFHQKEKKKLPQNKPSRDEPCCPGVIPRPWSDQPSRGTGSQKCICAPIFLNLCNFETERYTSEKHEIKSLDFQEVYEFDLSLFVVSRFVPQLRKFKKNGRAQYIFDCQYTAALTQFISSALGNFWPWFYCTCFFFSSNRDN